MALVQADPVGRWRSLTVVILLMSLSLAGCFAGDDDVSSGTTSPAASRSDTGSAAEATPADQQLSALAAKGVAAQFTGKYALDSNDPAEPDATVTIYRLASSYRVDVIRGEATSILMTATDGVVSCQVEVGRRTCLLVAAAGQQPPELFDPRLQRLFTTNLSALAAGAGATVTAAGSLPATGPMEAASCFQAAGGAAEPGKYCLTAAGILRAAEFPSGVLELTELSGPPAADVFTPPATPTPLPS